MSKNAWYENIVNSADHWFKKIVQKEKLTLIHNGGFFSCCSVRLHYIVEYFNNYEKMPEIVDTTGLFHLYKSSENQGDITFDYFEHYNNYPLIPYVKPVDYNENYQYNNYSHLQYLDITPFIMKYFSPSDEIKNSITRFEIKYKIDYDNICVLFYRGNDKNRETRICDYNEYILKAKEILLTNSNIIFLIQSDETEFIHCMQSIFPNNSFCFSDEIRHINKTANTVDILLRDNIDIFSRNYLAITIIMSKCKYIVCGSGNCSIWMMFYRGNNKNVFQNLNGGWINP